ncbi:MULTISPECIES: BMP family ABC transporter substrate-binding protein [Halanaerobium]|jgi:basic membrane protein A|uniref:Basic membrane protein A n=1 Tax=Halanaerobium kushneri TaxID=56779 RepID=A0A1N7C2P5_9FIRM|nr:MULTISPECIES: BMP family ABC transporter substrate-binding protein [Halanaerobium]RCW52684.1 nucleoside-binding protein [Halanaerobium sp. ST460_2HS_T2]SIR57859.1 basic membrane protein A [Halanaerobium kushneri]
MNFKLLVVLLVFFLFISFSVSAQYLEVALVSDVGGFGDKSYNDQLRKSLIKVSENSNLKLEFRESNLMTEYQSNINYFAENDFDLIWGVGFTMEQAIKEAAQMYPETNFVLFDGVVEEKNVMSMIFNKEEEAFLAGIVAALTSNSSKVAFVGGQDTRTMRLYQLGFKAGADTVNSGVEVISRYVGSFNDFSAAKEISSELINENVDLIFYAAGAASRGIIDTAIEEDIKLITLDSADISLAPNNIITAVLKNTDYLVKQLIENFGNDNYNSEIREYGLDDNAFILEQNQLSDMLDEEKIKRIEEYKQQFLAGEIELPSVP